MLKEVYRSNSIRKNYFCPRCYNVVKLNNFPEIELPEMIDIESDEEVVLNPIINLNIDIDCPKCDSPMVSIDDLMIDSIIEFNKKGVKTLACCQGHNDSIPYILFDIVDGSFKQQARDFTYVYLQTSELIDIGDFVEISEEYAGLNRFTIYYKNLNIMMNATTGIEFGEYIKRASEYFTTLAKSYMPFFHTVNKENI